jgi:hypothetical protein
VTAEPARDIGPDSRCALCGTDKVPVHTPASKKPVGYVYACACSAIYCYVHNIDEAVPDDAFLVCFDCQHVYVTADDLVREWVRYAGPEMSGAALDNVPWCPYCGHDF